jgi:hypothetical protein
MEAAPGGARGEGAPAGARPGHGVEQLRAEGTSEELRAEQGRGVGWRSSGRSTAGARGEGAQVDAKRDGGNDGAHERNQSLWIRWIFFGAVCSGYQPSILSGAVTRFHSQTSIKRDRAARFHRIMNTKRHLTLFYQVLAQAFLFIYKKWQSYQCSSVTQTGR